MPELQVWLDNDENTLARLHLVSQIEAQVIRKPVGSPGCSQSVAEGGLGLSVTNVG